MLNMYNVQGMTCDGCADGVYKLLARLEGVKGVGVDLKKQEAVINSMYRINLPVIQDGLLGTQYRITEQTALPSY